MRHNFITDLACGNFSWPAHHGGDPETSLPIRVLLASERCNSAIWPHVVMRTVIGRINDNRVIRYAELVKLVEKLSDQHVVSYHGIVIETLPR